MTVIQRASQALKLDPHFHTLVLDGVYVRQDDGSLAFSALPPPTEKDIAHVSEIVARRVTPLLAHRGMDADASDGEQADDPLASEEPALAAMGAASVQGVVATGPRQGCFVMRMGMTDDRPIATPRRGLCAEAAGFNVHAGVRVAARDRKGLERLCRYIARGPLSADRLRELPDGKIALTLRKPLRDGATHLVFQPCEFLEKLVPLLPAPRVHQTRFHGVLAPAARHRKDVVPRKPIPTNVDGKESRPHRPSWAALLARVFAIDILACPRCDGRMKIIAAITQPDALRRILHNLGLPTEPPLPHPPRAPRAPPDAADFVSHLTYD